MSAPAVLRSAMGHVRTPLYFNAYALIASNALTSALGLVYWSLAARLYPAEVLGASSAAISLMLFLSGVAQLNLRVALLRLVPQAGSALRALVLRCYGLTLLTSTLASLLVFGGVALLGSPWTALPQLATPAGLGLLVVGTAAWSIFNLQDGVLAGLRRTVWVPIENGAYATAKIVVLVVLVGSLPTAGIVASWIVPSIVAVAIVSGVLLWRWLPAQAAAHAERSLGMERRRLLGFVAADSVGAMFALAATTLLPVLVVTLAGPTTGAWFSIAWTIVAALMLVPLNMAASMTVETVHAGAHLPGEVRRMARHVALVLGPLIVFVALFAPLILGIFGPAYAANGTDLLRVACVGLAPFSVTVLAMAAARVRGQGRTILLAQAAAAVLTLTGALLLLGPMGLVGVGLAWTAAQSVVAVGSVMGVLRPLLRG